MTFSFLIAFLLWNFAMTLSCLGLGSLLARWLLPSASDPFVRIALGLSAQILLGGLLALTGLFLPPVCWAIWALGLLAALPELPPLFRGLGGKGMLWLVLAVVGISVIGISRLYVVDPSDDEIAYFPLVADLLARGVADQPLSLRAALGFGGQTVLQAIFSLPGNIRFAAAYDWFLPAVAFLFLGVKHREIFKESFGAVLVGAFALLLLLPYGSWNSTPSLLAVLPLVALTRLEFKAAPWRTALICALLVAGAAALRPFWAVAGGLIVFFQCLAASDWKWKSRGLCLLIASLGSIAFILPYLVSQILQFSTPSTLLLPGNIVADYLRYPNPNPLVGLATIVAACLHPEALGLLFCAIAFLYWKPSLAPVTLALLFLFFFVCFQCGDLDANYAVRYGKPFLLTIVLLAYLSVFDKESASRPTAPLLLLASGLIWSGAALPGLRNSWQIATATPLATAYDSLDQAGKIAGAKELQDLIPAGEKILALNSFPRHLDFRRNPIVLGDLPGTIHLLPVSSRERLFDSCRRLGIQWIIASDPKSDPGYRSEKFPHHELRFHQRKWLPDHRRFTELNLSLAADCQKKTDGGNCLIQVP